MTDPYIKGLMVDDQSRCIHWNSELDVIAFKFKCCDSYYCCHSCHEETADHPIQRYDIDAESNTKVVICGVCKNEMTFQLYRDSDAKHKGLSCPNCNAAFNPKCSLHYDIYFKSSQFDDPCNLK
ncbi:hypothetical protein TPHA_0N01680 [Tetrapisispora phaffii CBS 4417]|uniref:CHY-type domain-containing protein n=1 Tax=Tetrapisispora phaffii (strain ATCC 24235 / CBS 4417 / NBRC 1672 / NRRL Y-8282 / UCD 70-5) TaxID=1071381 RepID=G8C1C1_TETPH|nr:hypothetical protein TPHA_0N01680 [Tetrapisispora phaffii CBS 4417]CCE65949.1 hypothetical protein TPHA_0N01680 [Tetrapisispora phaffii CBS 4417]